MTVGGWTIHPRAGQHGKRERRGKGEEMAMTYSTGSGRYEAPPPNPDPQVYGPQFPTYNNPPSPSGAREMSSLLTVGVIILGVLSFGLGVMPYAQASVTGQLPARSSQNFFDNSGLGVGLIGLSLLLAAALVAAFGMLPSQPGNEAVVAGLSVAGFVSLVFLLLGLDAVEAGVGLILILVSSVLQAALAVGSVLLSSGIVKSASSAPSGYAGQRAFGLPQPFPQPQAAYRPAPGSVPAYGRPPSPPAGTTTQTTENTPNQ
jgi:hypothetical protein